MAIIFWAIVLLALNWGLALIRVVVNPDWYYDRRSEAGLDILGISTRRVIAIKAIQLAACTVAILYLGREIEYW